MKGSGRRLRGHLGRMSAAYLVLAVVVSLTGLAWYYVRENVEARERERFEDFTEATELAVEGRMVAYVDAMLGARGLFVASDAVTRAEWREYVYGTDLMGRYPGIQAIGYAERVRPEEQAAFVEGVRDEGHPFYNVRPGGERPEYFPVTYLEPMDERRNGILFGYDPYSASVNRTAMQQARDTGSPRASGRVIPLSAVGSFTRTDFFVYVPVYENGAPQGTVAERRRALRGFIVGAFRTDSLLEGIFGQSRDSEVGLEIFDGTELTHRHLLHNDDGALDAPGNPNGPPGLSALDTLEVAGRTWSLYFAAQPEFASGPQNDLPLLVLLSGLATGLVLFGAVWMLVRSRVRAERAGAALEAANRELQEANRRLETANRELDAFSYSVSHDLRAPLRGVDGFSQILLEDYAGALDDAGRDYLRRVRAASQRMGHMIDDLLELSRVGRTPLRRERVDLGALAAEIAAGLAHEDPRRQVRFVVAESLADDLVADGDGRLLRVVLENLLGNAWKFTSRKEAATIEFGAVERGGEKAYFVRDDGAGFDAAYADKLFGAFQRLHGVGEFPGTGIGLATVARIVGRHGGRVWAEGEVGRGATFYFTL